MNSRNEIQLNLFDAKESLPDNCEAKVCIKCKLNLPISSYSLHSGGNYTRSECKKCNYEIQKQRNYLRLSNGLPSKDYLCPICLKPEKEVSGKGNKKNGPWVLDHDHETKEFRGYLCHGCNRALGCFSDDIEKLKRAIEYLEK